MKKKTTPSSNRKNHRTRVGAERRSRMKERIFDHALKLLARGSTITVDQIVHEAKISRGTFYNHFKTYDELLHCLGDHISDRLLQKTDQTVVTLPDPLSRIATGIRLFFRHAFGDPYIAHFIWSAGFSVPKTTNSLTKYLARDISAAKRTRQVTIKNADLALLIIKGISLSSLYFMTESGYDEAKVTEIIKYILRALGADDKDIERVTKISA